MMRILGRKLLVSLAGADRTLKLYDVLSGRDVWSQAFPPRSAVLATENPGLTGVIEPKGLAKVLDVETGQLVFQTNLLQGPVGLDDVVNLEEPLLLQDRDRYYIALNQPLKVHEEKLYNNFANGLRCRTVNGWVLSFFREDGQHMHNGNLVNHKKGGFDWCSPHKIENQFVIVEQFENLPLMLFSARYQQSQGYWLSFTLGLQRSTGKRVYWSGQRLAGQSPPFGSFVIHVAEATINLIGLNSSNITVQLYVNDGRNRPVSGGPGGSGNSRDLRIVDRIEPAIVGLPDGQLPRRPGGLR